MAKSSSRGRHCFASETRTEGLGGIRGAGRSAARADCARSRLWFWQELRRELSVADSVQRSAGNRISSTGGNIAEIVHWTNIGQRRKRRRARGPPLRNYRFANRAHSERSAGFENS